ncbi:MAG: hypothetical protein E7174_02815 [Firmicutes bacterium]|nr:hypothetical protein [Bacillota bacterium]
MKTKIIKSLNGQTVQINENAFKRSKEKNSKFKLIVSAVVVAAIVVGGAFAIKKAIDKNDQKRRQSVVQYYGEESLENNIIRYIDISKDLFDLDLYKYDVDESLFEKYNISNELMSPEEIKELINQNKLINSFISKKDITTQSENVEIVLNLIRQEQLVNEHIYTTGYSVAHSNSTEATKKYVGEVFGIDDYENITTKYSFENGSGESSVGLFYNDDHKTKSYDINSPFFSSKKIDIVAGVKAMNDTDNSNDHDLTDNDEYNKERNKLIKKAIEQSAILNIKVDNQDLYDEDLARRMH